jgi:phage terminase small subunit
MSASKVIAKSAPTRDHPYKMGPAMTALNDRRREFVMALLEQGDDNYTRAYMAAGYTTDYDSAKSAASRLAHEPAVQAAIAEESRARLQAGLLMSVSALIKIAGDEQGNTKDRLTAIRMVMDRGGLPVETVSTTKHVVELDDKALIAKVKGLAAELGLDATKLLGSAGVVEAEFTEVVKETSEGLEDVL